MLTLEELNELEARLRPFVNSEVNRIRRAPMNDPVIQFRLNQEWPDPTMSESEIRDMTVDGRVFKADGGKIYVSNQNEIEIQLYLGPKDPANAALDGLYRAIIADFSKKDRPRNYNSITVPEKYWVPIGAEGVPPPSEKRSHALFFIEDAHTGLFPYGPPGTDPTLVWQGFAFSRDAFQAPACWIWIPKLHQLMDDPDAFRFIYRGVKLRSYKRDDAARATYRVSIYYAVNRLSDEPKLDLDLDDPFDEPMSKTGDPVGIGTAWDPDRFKEEALSLFEQNSFLRRGRILPIDLQTKRPLTAWKTENWPVTEDALDAIIAQYGTPSLGLGWIPAIGVTVIDVDAFYTGDLEHEVKFYRELGYRGPIFQTRRGLHFFFSTPPSVRVGTRNQVATLLGRVDFRVGEPEPRGFIALPLNDPARRVVAPGEPDESFLHYPIGRSFEVSVPIRNGQRNETLFRLLCSMRGTGFYEELLFESVAERVNQTYLSPPLRRVELRTLVRSVLRYPEPVARSIAQPVSEDVLDRLLKQLSEPPQQENEPAVRVYSVDDLQSIRTDPLYLWMEPGQATVIKGPPKAGKTTFVRTVISKALESGLRIAWLCMEEGGAQFGALARRFPRLLQSDRSQLAVCFPNRVQFDQNETLRWLLRYAMNGYQILVIDPVGPTCVDPKRPADKSFKNDYDAVYRFILMMRRIADYTGSHVLLIHHTGKGGLDTTQSSLGSTAFDAAPDNLVQVRKDDMVHVISRHYGNHEFRTPYSYETGQRDLYELEQFFESGGNGYNKQEVSHGNQETAHLSGDHPGSQAEDHSGMVGNAAGDD